MGPRERYYGTGWRRMSNNWGEFFWRPSRFPGEAAQQGPAVWSEGQFPGEIAADPLIRDVGGADRWRSRLAAAENSRWPGTSLA